MEASSSPSPLAQPAHPGALPAEDAEDPELVALPAPPKRERTVALLVLAATALASCLMTMALGGDIAYALSPSTPMLLGELRDVPPSVLADSLADNRFVQAHGVLGAVGAIRFERAFASESFRVSPLAGRRDLWVEVRVPPGQENGRYMPPTTFAGRLVRFDEAGPRHRGLVSAIAAATGDGVPNGARLLVDGEAPAGARGSVALGVLFLGFALWNVAAIARLVRRVK
jgi:hypothetical protein